MQVRVRLYGPMRVVVGQSDVDLSFDASSITLAQVLEVLTADYPRVRRYLLDASGALLPFVRILLNNERPDLDVTLATPLQANDQITFLTPVAGGTAYPTTLATTILRLRYSCIFSRVGDFDPHLG